jgi:hypothetical protein
VKSISSIGICAAGLVAMGLGCGPDAGFIDPGAVTSGLGSDQRSARYSDWSLPQTLGDLVNSTSTEQQPALSKDGLSLYFASNRPGGLGSFDIYVSRRACTDGCLWTAAELVPNVNTRFPDISPTLSRDGHQLFFSSQRSNGHCTANPPTVPQCDRDLWVSYRADVHNDADWQTPVNLGDGPTGINSSKEELAPSYFENDPEGYPQLFFNDGVTIGGALLGGNIFVSQLIDGTWSKPEEPAGLNTTSSEQRPSISHNGLELYFWSDQDGAGRLWVASRGGVSDPWSAPVRVRFPFMPDTDPDPPTIMPFIHAHGRSETLVFVRGVPGEGSGRDLWISERTRQDRLE